MELNSNQRSNRILAFEHRFLGSPWCKHCSSPERNVGQKVVWTSKKTILTRDYGFFAAVLSLDTRTDDRCFFSSEMTEGFVARRLARS